MGGRLLSLIFTASLMASGFGDAKDNSAVHYIKFARELTGRASVIDADTIEIVSELEAKGVGFRSITEHINTTTSGDRLVF